MMKKIHPLEPDNLFRFFRLCLLLNSVCMSLRNPLGSSLRKYALTASFCRCLAMTVGRERSVPSGAEEATKNS